MNVTSTDDKQTLWGVCVNAVNFAAAAAYFVYWNWKTPIRNGLRRGSLWVLSVFTLFIAVEVASEVWHDELLQWVTTKLHEYHQYAFYIFIAAVLFVLWHHRHERKKPEYEYRFLLRLYETEEYSRRGTGGIAGVLEIIYSAFKRSGIRHVSIHTLTADGQSLEIKHEHVFPKEDNADYFVALKSGQGVGGRVFADSIPRYMPRLFFPNWTWAVPFHHAIQLAFREGKGGNWFKRMVVKVMSKFSARKPKSQELELVPDGFNLNVYSGGGMADCYRSILCVPLKTSDAKTVGVLNFDFGSTDPLDKGDVAMAVLFGIVIGDIVGTKGVTGRGIGT